MSIIPLRSEPMPTSYIANGKGDKQCSDDSAACSPGERLSPSSQSPESLEQLAFELSMVTMQKCQSVRGAESDSGASSNEDHDLNSQAAFEAWMGERRHLNNITTEVPVPSSEHVAEIVGRQGCKIKALRAKTNTYIKTPVRGEQPMFTVTGREEDVANAKQEIVSAAEHFTQIRASRRHITGQVPAPGHVTAYVRVPYKVVGLVVGPKGATIKRIQQDTHTYIITPSRDREPIFEVTGLPDNVETARRDIETHIYQRTGSLPITTGDAATATEYSARSQQYVKQADMHTMHDFRMNGSDQPFNNAIHQQQLQQFVDQRAICKPLVQQQQQQCQQYPAWSTTSSWTTDTASDITMPYPAPNQHFDSYTRSSSDEGLGDSPPNPPQTSLPFLLGSSIWSDLDNPTDQPTYVNQRVNESQTWGLTPLRQPFTVPQASYDDWSIGCGL